MTNPTPHGQVPEALIDLIDAYAETRHRCGGIYNAKTEAARKAVIEALSGVQALSAAPAVDITTAGEMQAFEAWYKQDCVIEGAAAKMAAKAAWKARAMLAASPTPPAEQQTQPGAVYAGLPERRRVFLCTKCGGRECESGSIHQTHPPCKCGYLGFAENLDFTEDQMRDFADRTHALRMQAATKAAPGDALDEALRERDDAEDFIDATLDEVLGHERPEWSSSYGRADALNDVQERMTALHKPAVDKAWGRFQSAMAAPQQEAQEPATVPYQKLTNEIDQILSDPDTELSIGAKRALLWMRTWVSVPLYTAPQQEAQEPVAWQGVHDQTDLYYTKPLQADVRPLYTAPLPAPAPLSEMPYEKRKAIQEGEQIAPGGICMTQPERCWQKSRKTNDKT